MQLYKQEYKMRTYTVISRLQDNLMPDASIFF